jgi:hypothetical protein
MAEPLGTFLDFLPEISDGELMSDTQKKFEDLIAACRHSALTGGKGRGSITLTIDLHFERGAADVEGNVKIKVPKARYPRSLFFQSADGTGLVRNDPRQHELPIKDAPAGATTLKVIG